MALEEVAGLRLNVDAPTMARPRLSSFTGLSATVMIGRRRSSRFIAASEQLSSIDPDTAAQSPRAMQAFKGLRAQCVT
jgi:hypothetical protein